MKVGTLSFGINVDERSVVDMSQHRIVRFMRQQDLARFLQITIEPWHSPSDIRRP